jgi:hypothetical protein
MSHQSVNIPVLPTASTPPRRNLLGPRRNMSNRRHKHLRVEKGGQTGGSKRGSKKGQKRVKKRDF